MTPWTVAHQAPLSMGFPRQEYCSGLPCPPPGDLPDPGIELTFLETPDWRAGFLPLCCLESPHGGVVAHQQLSFQLLKLCS